MGVLQAMALIGNVGQATSEGKSDPVETGLTGPAATALDYEPLPYHIEVNICHDIALALHIMQW